MRVIESCKDPVPNPFQPPARRAVFRTNVVHEDGRLGSLASDVKDPALCSQHDHAVRPTVAIDDHAGLPVGAEGHLFGVQQTPSRAPDGGGHVLAFQPEVYPRGILSEVDDVTGKM